MNTPTATRFSLYALLLGLSSLGFSQTSLDELHIVTDTVSTLPATIGSTYSSDDEIISFDLNTSTATSATDLGGLVQAGIDGFHRSGDGCGDAIYSLDTTTMIAGTAMRPADVFTAAGVKILNADSAGIPAGVNVDAVSREATSCDLVISIDTTAMLNSIAFRPDDLISWNSIDGFGLYQATALNVNIDALHLLSANRALLSVDVASALPDVTGFDEDVFEVQTSGTALQLISFQPALSNVSWQAADLNALWALPTPIVESIFSDSFE